MAVMVVLIIFVICAAVGSAVTALIHGYHYYLRGKLDAEFGEPLFVYYDPQDGPVQRLFFGFWNWCERKGYEKGRAS
jgi:hypothetical protein